MVLKNKIKIKKCKHTNTFLKHWIHDTDQREQDTPSQGWQDILKPTAIQFSLSFTAQIKDEILIKFLSKN